MFEIKHTLCPSCSVGCGINVILDNNEIVGTFPYKRHPVNEGKNCLNGRSSIEEIGEKIDFDSKALDEIIAKLKSCSSEKVTAVFSGNNSNEDLDAINSFCSQKGYNILSYADNLKNFEEVVSYEDIESASKIFVIGNVLYENPLIGRRIIHAKDNGARIVVNDKLLNSPTANIADEVTDLSVKEFIQNNNDNLTEDSILIFNKVDCFDDLDLIENLNSKLLPVYSKSNSKGALKFAEAISKEDAIELLNNTEILLIFNDDIVNEFDFDFKSISQIILFSPSKNDTAEIANYVIPIKSWLEYDGSFTNAEDLTQEFKSVCASDNLGIAEIIEKLNED
ncbi:hypothetical protein [Methanobrevibacter sp.]